MLADEMVQGLIKMYRGPERPFFKMAVATQLFLLRSVTDTVWGAFVAHTNILASDNIVVRGLRQHANSSRADNVMKFTNLDAALTLAAGALLEAMRQIVRRKKRPPQAYVEEVVVMILRGLGVKDELAAQTVSESAAFIRANAADRLPWWRDPWA